MKKECVLFLFNAGSSILIGDMSGLHLHVVVKGPLKMDSAREINRTKQIQNNVIDFRDSWGTYNNCLS